MFERIVVGVNKTETARSAGDQAVELANLLGAELHLVSCYDEDEAAERPAEQHTQSFLDSVASHVETKSQTHVMRGDPTEAILAVAEQVNADLIVVGNKGMHGARRMLSSVPKAVSHRAPCAVLILATT